MIICCGEALIDMLPRKLADGANVFLPVAGGAIFNTAIALGRLGEQVGFVSGISTDMFGQQLIETLEASHVDASHSVRNDQPTTLAFVRLTDGHASYSFFDESSAGRSIRETDMPEIGTPIAALHFGAISLIGEPCGSAYEAFARRHSATSVISLDPNIRPGFIKDADAHRARILRMIAMADIVKVSDEDLDWIVDDGSQDGFIANMLETGVSLVLLTRGGDGVVAYSRDGELHEPALKADVVDTVGAGDTFNAGLLSGLNAAGLLSKAALAKADLAQVQPALAFANTVAAFVVGQAGCVPPWRDQLAQPTPSI
ncbi:MAG: carbohydrate kinase [Ahrensia sp.]|nr:carbohydrate kinase [Ahrensia sp.]